MCNFHQSQLLNEKLIQVKFNAPYTQLNQGDHFLYAEFSADDTHVNVHRAKLSNFLFKDTKLIGCCAVLYDERNVEISIRDADMKHMYFLPKKYESLAPMIKMVRLKKSRFEQVTFSEAGKVVLEIDRLEAPKAIEGIDIQKSQKLKLIYCKLIMDETGECYR